ncbi:MAG: GNAT superfamily N-acetyltransferase [Flavobacteriaceae bacterium]|jgi:GNAT superfamily N-acetyltransferase
MNYIVRKANLKDMPILLDFEQGVIEVERPMDSTLQDGRISYYDITELITSENSEVFVVEIDTKIVASGYAKIMKDKTYLKHDKQGYLGFMFVLEDFRGRGYNKLILDTLMSWCKERGIFEIRLDVYDMNEAALRAYEKAGFKKHLINMRMNIKNPDV